MRHFANAVLLATAVLAMGVALRGLAGTDDLFAGLGALRNAALFVGLPGLVAAAVLLALRLKREWRATIAVCLVTAAVGIYGAEGFLAWRIGRLPHEAAARLGLDYDGRSMRQVIRDFAQSGQRAVPALWPGYLLERQPDGSARSVLMVDGRETIPVGGVSGTLTVMCHEVGPYLTYVADRHGFNNPDLVWSQPVELMLVGDSFPQGQCVPPDAQMAMRLRTRLPTVTLAMGHDGPLLELAALKEFGPQLKPRAVLWLYYQGNDLIEDLPRERASPLLMRYLDPGFSQDLADRQDAIDTALLTYLEGPSRERDQARRELMITLTSVAKLRNLRRFLGADRARPEADTSLFARILHEARRTVAGWGGTLYFVYLPGWQELMSPTPADIRLRAQVLKAARDAGLAIIDLYGPMTSEGDPSAFFYYPGSHYSPEGHAEVADTILQALESQPASTPLK